MRRAPTFLCPFRLFGMLIGFALISHFLSAAPLPSGWQYQQQFTVAESGLIKVSLPLETIDASRPGFEDLRIYDSAGQEVPFLLERSSMANPGPTAPDSFVVSLQENSTVITIETGLTEPLEAITLETPANNFIKPVQVEGSKNNQSWEKLAEGLAIFRQRGGVDQLQVAVPKGVWPFLRVTIEDRRSQPIPFTGARVHGIAEATPVATAPVTIGEREETAGETRLKLRLGAANLRLANVRIETPEPLFMRRVTVMSPVVTEDAIHERPVAEGVFYRVATEGQPVASNLSVAVEAQIPSREIILFIQNQDSPPLPIAQVFAEHRPVYAIFLAKQAGQYHLLSGNRQCAAARYDLASFGGSLKKARPASIDASPRTGNPSYQAPETLPGIQEGGTTIDVSAWSFRKQVQLADATAQQVELDLDVLALAESDLHDLRVVRDGRQIPYIFERASTTRALAPQVSQGTDPNKPKLSRWTIKLPRAGLPISKLVCSARTPVFERSVLLYENVNDDRGAKRRRVLYEGVWRRTPEQGKNKFAIAVNNRLQGDTLMLETDNGDNPPIELEQFKIHYAVTRVLFKGRSEEKVFLYYGNRAAHWPRYDLGLVAGQLLGSPKGTASLGPQEQLRKTSSRVVSGKGGPIFWSILAVVVVALLAIIARLLPKQ